MRALTNHDLIRYAKQLNIPNFRGVFMRDDLPRAPRKIESAIVNLDSMLGEGTHWVCYKKSGDRIQYYDSFGDIPPPKELKDYLGANIEYNYDRQQNFNSVICGHLCLKRLAQDV